jgi:hypothetical protein
MSGWMVLTLKGCEVRGQAFLRKGLEKLCSAYATEVRGNGRRKKNLIGLWAGWRWKG